MRQPPTEKRSLDRARREAASLRVTDELRQPTHLGARHTVAERGETIVPSPLVVSPRAALLDFNDEPLLDHSSDRPIERAGAQTKLAVGSCLDVLDDGVAVPLALGEGKQDVQRCRGQRQEVVGGRFRAHADSISTVATPVKSSLLAQRHHRLDADGAPGGNEAREERNEEQNSHRTNQYGGIRRRDAEEQRLEVPCCRERADQAEQ